MSRSPRLALPFAALLVACGATTLEPGGASSGSTTGGGTTTGTTTGTFTGGGTASGTSTGSTGTATAPTSCGQGTFQGATCHAAGEVCGGVGPWQGWTCTCEAGPVGSTWACTAPAGGQGGQGGAACGMGVFDGVACQDVGASCAGTGKWVGWTCTCLSAKNGATWSCKAG